MQHGAAQGAADHSLRLLQNCDGTSAKGMLGEELVDADLSQLEFQARGVCWRCDRYSRIQNDGKDAV